MSGYPKDDSIQDELCSHGLSSLDANSLLEWIGCARRARPAVLVGAGLSAGAPPKRSNGPPSVAQVQGLATWRGLAQAFRARLSRDIEHSSTAGDAGETDPLWLAQLYCERFGRASLINLVRELLPDHEFEPSLAHKSLRDIRWDTILTTNYDALLKRAFELSPSPRTVHVVSKDADLVSSRSEIGVEVVHLHGTFDDSDGIVITLEDYRTFPTRRPGLIAKVRQVFLQHPVLLLGFSGTDPNFVTWAGWVRDVAQDRKHPWVSLHVGDAPSAARSSYWKGLSFVTVRAEKIATIVGILAKALRRDDSMARQQLILDARSTIRSAQTVEQLIDALNRARPILPHAATLWRGASMNWEDLVCEAAERALHLSPPIDRPPRHGAGAEERRTTITATELRVALGARWSAWLLCASEFGASTLRGHRFEVDFLSESSKLPSDDENKAALDLCLLEARVEVASEQDAARILSSAKNAAERSLDPRELERVRRVSMPRDVQQGRALTRHNNGSAAAFRSRGFESAMNGDAGGALTAYHDAVIASQAEDEPLDVQELTLRSAIHAYYNAYEAPAREARSRVDISVLEQREHALRTQIPFSEDFRGAEREGLQKAFEIVADAEFDGVKFIGNPAAGDLQRAYRYLEQHCSHPSLVRKIAERWAFAAFYGDSVAVALRVLAAYNSDRTSQVARRALVGGDEAVADAAAAMLEHGRWLHEWRRRAEALQILSPYVSDLDALEAWERAALDVLRPTSEGVLQVMRVRVARVRALGPDALRAVWADMLDCLGAIRNFEVSDAIHAILGIPFALWLREDRLNLAEFEAQWQELRDRVEGVSADAVGAVYELAFDVAREVRSAVLSAGLESFASDATLSTGQEWLTLSILNLQVNKRCLGEAAEAAAKRILDESLSVDDQIHLMYALGEHISHISPETKQRLSSRIASLPANVLWNSSGFARDKYPFASAVAWLAAALGANGVPELGKLMDDIALKDCGTCAALARFLTSESNGFLEGVVRRALRDAPWNEGSAFLFGLAAVATHAGQHARLLAMHSWSVGVALVLRGDRSHDDMALTTLAHLSSSSVIAAVRQARQANKEEIEIVAEALALAATQASPPVRAASAKVLSLWLNAGAIDIDASLRGALVEAHRDERLCFREFRPYLKSALDKVGLS